MSFSLNIQFVKSFFWRLFAVYIVLFIFSFPVPNYILPNFGALLNGVFEPISKWVGVEVLDLNPDLTYSFDSDSTGLYIHVFIIGFVSCFVTAASLIFKPISFSEKHKNYLKVFSSYYLSMVLMIYAFDKIFNHQFYLPEPNILYSQVGDLSKDISFWTTMGASRSYSMFSGFIELVPAILLLFNRTRLIGALIAFMVMLNVLMINFGFDISVKVFSLFLTILALFIISYDYARFKAFILNSSFTAKKLFKPFKYSLHFSLVVLFVLSLNGAYPFIKNNNFNDDNAPRPKFHGAYEIVNSHLNWKSVFIHRQGYLIIQNKEGEMNDYKMHLNENEKTITLTNNKNQAYEVKYLAAKNELKSLIIKNDTIKLKTLVWKNKALVKPYFHWTID